MINSKTESQNFLTFPQYLFLFFLSGFVVMLGIGFIYLRFKVRDLKIAINATQNRIEKLKSKESHSEADVQSRIMKWNLKQVALQDLGMEDFKPYRLRHMSFQQELEDKYQKLAQQINENKDEDEKKSKLYRLIQEFLKESK